MKVISNKREYKGYEIERNWAGYVVSKNGQQLVVTTQLKSARKIIDKKVA